MTATVRQTTFLDCEAVQVENDHLQATIVPKWGSSLLSLVEKKTNTELMRKPETQEAYEVKPALYGTPVLFPPNRIEDGTFTFNNRTYTFDLTEPDKNNHIHGFLMERPWQVIEADANDEKAWVITEFRAADDDDILRQFPHPFIVRMTFTLETNILHKNATVINDGNETFPWGIGYHTTFRFPFRNKDALDQCTFALSADKHWELTDRLLPTGERVGMDYAEQMQNGMNIVGWEFDDPYESTVDQNGKNEATLTDQDAQLRIRYQADEHFKHWVIYNADGKQGFFCPEPYTWITNTPNLDLPDSVTGFKTLEPGKEETVRTKIIVEHA